MIEFIAADLEINIVPINQLLGIKNWQFNDIFLPGWQTTI